MKQVLCSKCGNKNPIDNKFCSYCGEKIEVKEKVVEIKPKKKQSNNGTTIIVTAFVTLFVCAITTLLIFNYYFKNMSNTIVKEERNVTITDTGIAEAVEKVYDSVVTVETYRNGSLYSTGTGFVFEKEKEKAYILTNNHVIANGDNIYVVFTNNKKIAATVVGKDTYSDVGVLSVAASNIISVAEIGSSETLRVGDTTFAVGAPVDSDTYSWTVTRGILSGKNREVEVNTGNNYFSGSSMVMEVLQTDAPINSGNSGGPLCNANGEVIGVTNMKLSSTNIEGIGFAIPIETAIDYATKFISGEKVSRPYLGVSVTFVSPGLYSDIKATGMYINEVESGSAAEKAGLKKDDIITKVAGKEIKSNAYFKYQLYKFEVGDTITLTYVRNNKIKETRVTLGENMEKE